MLQAPQYRRPALSPSELEERAAALALRHGERVSGLEQAGRAQAALKAELQAAMADEEQHIGLLDKLMALFVDQPHTPLLESLTAHHEAALECVRALGHHIEALETDLRLLERDLKELNREHRDAWADASEAALALQRVQLALSALNLRRKAQDNPDLSSRADDLEALLWERGTEKRRFDAAAERLHGLAELHRDLRLLLRAQHESLSRLHAAGTATLQGMSRHVATLRAAASAKDLAEETATAFEELKGSVARACDLADASTSTLSVHVDALEQRMRTLDAEANERREATLEVEKALERFRRWQ